MFRLLIAFVAILTSANVASAKSAATQPVVKHVLLIGLDGARPDAIRDHAGPAVRSLIESGASCWSAQAVLPSVTQVNWASVLTGCAPEKHGINAHPVTRAELEATTIKVPTLFDHVARSGKTAAGFLGHWKLYPLESTTPGAMTFRSSYESTVVAREAAKYIIASKPTFCFVYLGDLDGLGHRHGWMSPAYLDGVRVVDDAVRTLLDAIDQTGSRDQTVVILTSDHGGRGKSHGAGGVDDRTIPWIASGPGIARGVTIDRPISTLDTTPTVLALLGLAVPETCDGSPVPEAVAAPASLPTSSPVR